MARVLVVDDNRQLCALYALELGETYEVDTVHSAREALERLTHHRPDVIVLDIKMPGMDGIEALGRILQRDRKVPVILNSAYSHFRDDFMTWAAEDYVVKSSDLGPLEDAIERALSGRHRGAAPAAAL
jgi:CheY-like chemotaxis protein